MSQVPLQKIRIIGMQKDYQNVMNTLQKESVIHITENDKNYDCIERHIPIIPHSVEVSRIDFAIKYLTPYKKKNYKKSKTKNFLTGGKLHLTEEVINERLKSFIPKSLDIVTECEILQEQWVREHNEYTKIPVKQAQLRPFGELNIKINTPLEASYTKTIIGKIPLEKLEKMFFLIQREIENNSMDIITLGKDDRVQYLCFTFVKNDYQEKQNKIEEIFTKNKFEKIDLYSSFLEFAENTPIEIIEKLELKKSELCIKLDKIKHRLIELSDYLEDLSILYDTESWKKSQNEISSNVFYSRFTFAIEAWIATKKVDNLEELLSKKFDHTVTIEKNIINTSEEPILLENPAGIKSFEPILEMYGLPNKKEFDPTIFMGLFFIIFFGMCLSDVGYGLLLLLTGLGLLTFGKFEKEIKNALVLITLCGGSAMIGGVLLGGYLGLQAVDAPSFMVHSVDNELMFIGQILDPMKNLMQFLVFALSLGAIQILLGLVLDFMKKWKNGQKSEAWFDSSTWFFLLLFLMIYAITGNTLFGYLTIVAVVALVLTQGRSQKNWVLKFVFGILGLYNIIGFLSDFLSYSRLMALGLATGVIAFAMNMTAGVLFSMMPNIFLGTIVAIFVIIFGHALNFFLSFLGAFIHSGRLQFIEFFGKFYEGGGKKFIPFERISKYIFIS